MLMSASLVKRALCVLVKHQVYRRNKTKRCNIDQHRPFGLLEGAVGT